MLKGICLVPRVAAELGQVQCLVPEVQSTYCNFYLVPTPGTRCLIRYKVPDQVSTTSSKRGQAP